MYKNYFLKNTRKIINFFFFNKVEEKKITYEKFIHLLGLKKNIGVCFAFKLSMFEFEFKKNDNDEFEFKLDLLER